jgi:hypothetical protein
MPGVESQLARQFGYAPLICCPEVGWGYKILESQSGYFLRALCLR